MKFGIFEHMDDSGTPLGEQFESRLALIEACDRYGFYGYHLAEHHGTPLGLAPSPSVFLAAVAQRTRRLRFGPLVYSLPLYHPVRLIEEICMLDQMSGGRFELGVGRGVSPVEVGFYGVDPADGPRQFPEALRVIKQGLTSDELTFAGEFYRFDKVPMVLKPVQQPHPPLWYGVATMESAHWAAVESANIVTLLPPAPACAVIGHYRQQWANAGRPDHELPLMGLSRHVVLDHTEAAAIATAERAYRRWRRHMELLWVQHGLTFPLPLPPELGPLLKAEGAFAGTTKGFRSFVERQIEATGASYFVCDLAFGDLVHEESMRTVELIAADVMPYFVDKHRAA